MPALLQPSFLAVQSVVVEGIALHYVNGTETQMACVLEKSPEYHQILIASEMWLSASGMLFSPKI